MALDEFDLVGIVVLFCSRVFDAAVDTVNFPLFLKKPCQVNFFKKRNYFYLHGLISYGLQDYAALTL
jgi:hypothetical protein